MTNKRECFDCDGQPGDCHMNCGPSAKHVLARDEYAIARAPKDPLRLFIVGTSKGGQVMAKRYTWIAEHGYASDFPLWSFPIETIGL